MLYHFSEDPAITVFTPRSTQSIEGHPSVVWAIDEAHAPHYYFPRDCPRVICWCEETTSDADRNEFFSLNTVLKIAAVESRWLERLRTTQLYVYTMPESAFELRNPDAGYYISYQEVEPIRVEPVGDLLSKLMVSNLELRLTPSLAPMRERVLSSTLGFSIIRFANAIIT